MSNTYQGKGDPNKIAGIKDGVPSGEKLYLDTANDKLYLYSLSSSAWLPACRIDEPTKSEVTLVKVDNPAIVEEDTVNLFGKKIAGRMMPAFIGTSGLASILQPFIGRNKITWATAVGNSRTLNVMGITLAATGVTTTAIVGTTNILLAQKRLEYAVTTASAAAVAGWREATAKYFIGGNFGGFTYVCRFGPSRGVAANATKRLFNGFTSSTSAPTDVNPSSITNCVGVGADSTDVNWQIMHRQGTNLATKIDTGIAKATSDNTEVYELIMFCAPSSTKVSIEFIRLSDNLSFTYETDTNIPTPTTMLAPRGCVSVGGTLSVVGISIINLYIGTDY